MALGFSRSKFYNNLERTDSLITAAREQDRMSKEKLTRQSLANDMQIAQLNAAVRSRGDTLSAGTALKQENLQQAEQTARQRLIQAGDLALESFRAKKSKEKTTAENVNALERIRTAGEETRRTKELENTQSKAMYEEILKSLSGNKKGYKFSPSDSLTIPSSTNTELDLEDLLSSF